MKKLLIAAAALLATATFAAESTPEVVSARVTVECGIVTEAFITYNDGRTVVLRDKSEKEILAIIGKPAHLALIETCKKPLF
jgi:hypothetical protein